MDLSRRDRAALAAGVAALLLFVLLQFVLFPLLDRRQRLEHGIQVREQALVEMRQMQERFRKLHRQNSSLSRQLARRDRNFSLFSFLEKMASATGIKQNIAYMKPSSVQGDDAVRQTTVEMKFKAISLKQLVSFLERIEAPEKLVAVRRIAIQENKKEKATLDVILQVISIDRMTGDGH
ncbi:MAG TPA: hypothetical protein ENK27_06510 [Desulfobulbus sp.]|nr:hypothetical protein [Desulfobulbus sp.]